MPWLPVCMAMGVLLFFWLLAEPPHWLGGVAVCACLGLVALAWRSLAGRMLALAALSASVGFMACQIATWRVSPMTALPRTAVILTGTVRAVDILPDGRRLVLDGVRLGAGDPVDRRLRVRFKKGDQTPVVAGDQIQVRALMRPPAGPSYPGGWDLQREAFFNGLGGGGTALGAVTVLDHHPPAGLSAIIQAARDAIGQRVMAAIPGAAGAIAATFLTGSTLAIPQADRAAMRDSGLAHLLAVAGLHIGIVMGLVFGTTRLLLAAWERSALFWPTKPIAAVTALLAGGVYMLMAGAHVPVLRSFAMACVVTLGLVVGRRALSLRGWALAALTLMLFAPQEVVGVKLPDELRRRAGADLGLRGPAAVVDAALRAPMVAAHPVARDRAGADEPARGYRVGALRRFPLRAYPVVFYRRQRARGAVDGDVGDAAGAARPGADAVRARGACADADGLGRAGDLVDRANRLGLAGGDDGGAADAGWGLLLFTLGLAWLALWRTRWRMWGVLPIVAGLLSPALVPLPDLLVSGDARLIALRVGPRFWLQSVSGGSKYTREEWENHFAAGSFAALAEGAPSECGAVSCQAGPVLLLRNKGRVGDGGCAGSTLLVSAEPARGECPRGVALLDRFTVWRDGAAAVWIEGGMARVVTDRQVRGDRPWVPGPPTPRRVTSTLPAAEMDALPPADAE